MDKKLIDKSTINEDLFEQYHKNLIDLRRKALDIILLITFIITYAACIRYFYFFQTRQLFLLLSLIFTVLLAYIIGKKNSLIGMWFLSVGTTISFLLEVVVNPHPWAKFIVLFNIILSTMALSRYLLMTVSLIIVSSLTLIYTLGGKEEIYLIIGFFSIGFSLISYISLNQIIDVIHETTQYVQLAREGMEEARSDRAKLAKTVKALDDGNYRLQKAYEAIAKANDDANRERELKTKFVNIISHELRAPLNFIVGVTDFMINNPSVYGRELWGTELSEDIHRLYQTSKYLSNLVDDVLTLGQIEANRMVLNFELSEIEEVIKDVISIIRPSYESRGLYLELEVGENIPKIYIDRVRIRQVILNLLKNALRFVQQGGVSIRIENLGTDISVSVEDTGVGIPETQLKHLFQEFFQADNQAERHESTSGLGLSISRQFIEMHQGSIRAESPINKDNHLPKGTRFVFTLPIDLNPDKYLSHKISHYQKSFELKKTHTYERKNLSIIVFSELEIEDLLHKTVFSPYSVIFINDQDEIEEKLKIIKPNILIEIGVDENINVYSHLIKNTNTAYFFCKVEQEDTGIEPLWEDYLVKPFNLDIVHRVVNEINPLAEIFLIVDDDENMLRFFELGLNANKENKKIIKVTNAESAKEYLAYELPHIMFLDIELPDINGLEFLKLLRNDKRYNELPVIITSARNKPFLYRTYVNKIIYIPTNKRESKYFIEEMEEFITSIRLF